MFVFHLGLGVCLRCPVLVWLGIGILFVGMCIQGAIMGLFSLVVDLLRLLVLVSVKNRVFLLACNVWVMRCNALLCLAICRSFIYIWVFTC